MNSTRLFYALSRRLHRLQDERRAAWAARDDALEDRLSRRCFVLVGTILQIELPEA